MWLIALFPDIFNCGLTPRVKQWDRLLVFDHVVPSCALAPHCGYWIKSGMTDPAALRPVVSRLRGNDGVVMLVLFEPCDAYESGACVYADEWMQDGSLYVVRYGV